MNEKVIVKKIVKFKYNKKNCHHNNNIRFMSEQEIENFYNNIKNNIDRKNSVNIILELYAKSTDQNAILTPIEMQIVKIVHKTLEKTLFVKNANLPNGFGINPEVNPEEVNEKLEKLYEMQIIHDYISEKSDFPDFFQKSRLII